MFHVDTILSIYLSSSIFPFSCSCSVGMSHESLSFSLIKGMNVFFQVTACPALILSITLKRKLITTCACLSIQYYFLVQIQS